MSATRKCTLTSAPNFRGHLRMTLYDEIQISSSQWAQIPNYVLEWIHQGAWDE
jgi:hypothetical protein